jgi:predicted O-linked N-acetylglucosamine transferase (SPINDLY family)
MPDDAEQLHRLGLSALQAGQADHAAELLARAVELHPTAELCLHLGDALRDAARIPEAIGALRRGLQFNPDMPELHNNLGVLLLALNQIDEAEAALMTAQKLCPTHVDPALNLGNLYARGGHPAKALEWYQRALQLDPNHAVAISNLAIVLQDVGLVDQAPEHLEQALKLMPGHPMIWSNLLMAAARTTRYDPAAVYRAHREFQRRIAAPWAASLTQPHQNDADPDRRLRIAYISSDFRRHPVGFFIEPLLAAHDHAPVHVTAYSCSAEIDEVTHRLRASVDEWRDVAAVSERDLVQQIRSDRIDILIDLAGHTIGHRLLTLAARPAPVQVTYLGYPNTTGLDAIDYRITDAYADPPGMTEALHSEKLLRLSPCAWCYRPPSDAPDVAPLPALASGRITFGSFNGLPKLSDATVQLWSGVLAAVPQSRLLLKTRNPFDEPTRTLTLQRFARHGVAPDRIELRSGTSAVSGHLAVYGQVDIALDPYPYHGTTTTCEALLMGVPVISLAGKVHASRVGVSLVANVGLLQLIADTPDQYIRTAAEWAGDLPRLGELRAVLRQRLLASPLCDQPHFAREFESALRSVWRQWCQGRGSA